MPNLKLKWAFGFPGGSQAYGHPAIVGGRVFVGSDNGRVYSLDAETGCTIGPSRRMAACGRRRASVADRERGVRGVFRRHQGQRVRDRCDERRADLEEEGRRSRVRARHRGADVADGRLYVPVSSVEEVPAAQPKYECCTFRGSVVALDAATGTEIWKSYTIPEAPQPAGRNSAARAVGAAGAAVWIGADDRSR